MISFNTNEIKSITITNSNLNESVLFGIIDKSSSSPAWVQLKASEQLELTCRDHGTCCLDVSKISTSEKKQVNITVIPRHLYKIINPETKRAKMEKIIWMGLILIAAYLAYMTYISSPITHYYSPHTVFF